MVREKTLLHHYFLFYFENQKEGKYSPLWNGSYLPSAFLGLFAVVTDKLKFGTVVGFSLIFISSESSSIS